MSLAYLRRWHGNRHHPAYRAIDRLNDLQQRDFASFSLEAISTASTEATGQNPRPGQGLENLQGTIDGNAQVIAHLAGLGGGRGILLAKERGRKSGLSGCFA